MVKVKICGITNQKDASLAVKLGAHALGFIFAPSPRQITPETARDIISEMPPLLKTIGVFVNTDVDTIKKRISFCGLDMVQLHGEESPELCRELMPRTIKAFRVKDESSLSTINAYHGNVRALLFDTYSDNKRGGTGQSFDWELAVKAKKLGIPIILAGGLAPSNIKRAISVVRPFAVDVNSGVEDSPGNKSPRLMKKLMDNIGEEFSG